MSARRANSALVNPNSTRRASSEWTTSSNMATRREAASNASAYSGSERRWSRYFSAAVLDLTPVSVTFMTRY
jgi:hypothetical protein